MSVVPAGISALRTIAVRSSPVPPGGNELVTKWHGGDDMARNEEHDTPSSVNIEPGQRWTSNIGGPALVVLEKATNLHGTWLVRSEANSVMTTIDEWHLIDDYDLADAGDSAEGGVRARNGLPQE